MASKLKATGLILLIVGVLTLTVFNLAWAAFPPFGGRTQTEFTEQSITGSSNEDVFVAFIPTNAILFLRINVVFDFQGNSAYSCEINVILRNDNFPAGVRLDGTTRYYDDTSATNGYSRKQIDTIILATNLEGSTSIYLNVNNQPGSSISISNRHVKVVYGLIGLIVPALFAVVGLILTAVSFTRKKEPTVRAPRAAPTGGWEPTLQWGGGAAKKKPKMAISTPKGKTTKKKVVRKVPKAGAASTCKFCGKEVASNAFFCPHCYGKLR